VAPPGRYRLLWRRFRPNLFSWAGMTPFLIFALFPFYWMVVTSLKADANLYDLSRNPFWFSQVDGSGRPYHKDIIIPASYSEGPIRWTISAGAHTTRFDSETDPKPIAHVGDQPIYSPVDGRLTQVTVPEGQVAQPNTVVGVIDVTSPSPVGTSTYNLADSLKFGAGITVNSATATVRPAPGIASATPTAA